MKDEVQTNRRDSADEHVQDGDKEQATKNLSEEASNLLIKSTIIRERDQPVIDIEKILGACTFSDSPREPMSKEEVDKSAGKIADVIAKKGGFGNAFDRDALNTLLHDAQNRGSLDEVLQVLNAQIKKTNPNLTISWNTTTVEDAAGGRKVNSTVNLIDATTGKPEDQARISTQVEPSCERVLKPAPRDPWSPWPGREPWFPRTQEESLGGKRSSRFDELLTPSAKSEELVIKRIYD